MRDFFFYLKSWLFFKHLAIALICLVFVLWGLIKLLDNYTQHGETADVPDFNGIPISELEDFVKDKNVRYSIIDSLYDAKQKTGIVIKQDPEAKTLVKHNRIIYLYVTSSQAPQIAMPKLIDRSERQALFMIENYDLKIGRITEVPGNCKGCVLKQLNNGKEIAPGMLVKKGSKIDLYIGKREVEYEPIEIDDLK
jgi:beta-lactam-binding protein with PASTA domain